ncbi:hypothetical protein BJY17_003572 [Agromyces hippuratus]|uniref:Uncharacterized protein n=2 Tax=Agromyces hippuratus TaxID=286438 RepID=A0A852XAF4_9MICO|nr:hypothetical protein [Agromyces hippuratus]NYG22825.1 hypothetical protein [Agromyces hippuratus]
MSVDLITVLTTVGFVGLLVGTSVLAGRGLGLEQRAGLLQRRDPATAEALRRAQSITDFASGSVFGDEGFYSPVCSPSRRSGLDLARVRGTDSDLRVEAAEEALPPMPATVVALGRSEHVPRATRTRHPVRADQPVRTAQPAETAKNSGHQPTASG